MEDINICNDIDTLIKIENTLSSDNNCDGLKHFLMQDDTFINLLQTEEVEFSSEGLIQIIKNLWKKFTVVPITVEESYEKYYEGLRNYMEEITEDCNIALKRINKDTVIDELYNYQLVEATIDSFDAVLTYLHQQLKKLTGEQLLSKDYDKVILKQINSRINKKVELGITEAKYYFKFPIMDDGVKLYSTPYRTKFNVIVTKHKKLLQQAEVTMKQFLVTCDVHSALCKEYNKKRSKSLLVIINEIRYYLDATRIFGNNYADQLNTQIVRNVYNNIARV